METNEHMDDVRKRFLKARKQLMTNEHVKSKAFADKVGIVQQNIYKIKSGERYPTLDAIVRLCVEFNYNPTWLILGEGNTRNISPLLQDPMNRLTELENIVKNMGKGSQKKAS